MNYSRLVFLLSVVCCSCNAQDPVESTYFEEIPMMFDLCDRDLSVPVTDTVDSRVFVLEFSDVYGSCRLSEYYLAGRLVTVGNFCNIEKKIEEGSRSTVNEVTAELELQKIVYYLPHKIGNWISYDSTGKADTVVHLNH